MITTGHERLKKLIDAALNSASQIADRQVNPWQEVVTVEIVGGCPSYFIGDDEVTATRAADALDNHPQPAVAA